MTTSAALVAETQTTCDTKTTCPYCGVGCGVIVKTQGEGSSRKIIQVVGDPDHPANYGKLCSKGSKLAETAKPEVYQQVRAGVPMMRTHRSEGSVVEGSCLEPNPVQPTTWDEALNYAADRFADLIKKHGPDSVAFYISGQLLTEDYYAFNKLAKGLIGTNNIDTNSRLCMSSAVSGYKRTLGADAPPCSYDDLSLAQCVFIAGSNMAFAHPVAYRRLEAARAANPKHKLIVVDPRKTDTAQMADLHLQIQPGTDVMLFNAMLNVMLSERLIDPMYISKYTEGFEAVAKGVQEYTPEIAASICGIKVEDIVKAARWFAWGGEQDPSSETKPTEPKPTLSLYCQGLNQATTGTDKNTALIALHLATGQIGKEGAGPFSLTGQPNAMGGREVGGMATILPGHRELANPQHVQEVAAYWGVPSISNKPGATAVELFDRLEKGEIKAVWIACTNPAHSMPNSDKIKRALDKAEFVVVQDAYLTPITVQYADVLLPATTWAEKEGTVTNSERRISRVTSAMPAWGESRNDWQIATQFAQLLQARLDTHTPSSMFAWTQPEQVFNEHRGLTTGRDLDITGLSYSILETRGPQQWPMPLGASQGKARLYEDGVFPTASGKAKFIWAEFIPVAEDADARFPWRLNTGRVRDHWHGSSRTGTLSDLFGHEPEPAIALNPKDFARLGLQAGDWVEVKSRRSTLWWRAKSDESVAMNQAYIPMHWGPEFTGGQGSAGGVNAFTLEQFDPYSKQPELKHTALKVSKVKAPWECVVFVQAPHWLSIWLEARKLFKAFDSAMCVPIGRAGKDGSAGGPDTQGLLFRAASSQAPNAEVLTRLEELFQLAPNTPNLLTYSDPRTGSFRRIRVEMSPTDGSEAASTIRLTGVMLAGSMVSESWLRSYFDQAMDVTPVRSFLLSPNKQPSGAQVSVSKVVCNCVGVMQADIQKAIQQTMQIEGQVVADSANSTEDAILAKLKCSLGCGTQCGSCVPELKKMIKAEGNKPAYKTQPILLT
ncbi:MAG: molybdopterin-dependent oxidoreductase [Limnobacter sp.]|nr:molybdopterin-dependent oxidoreductase [Limnobacter sp.]